METKAKQCPAEEDGRLNAWLSVGRCLWAAEVPAGKLSAWSVNGHIVLVETFADGGWDVFVPACQSGGTNETLDAAARACGLAETTRDRSIADVASTERIREVLMGGGSYDFTQGEMQSPEEAVIDLLTDVRHFCEAERIDANGCIDLARMHFDEEMPQPGKTKKIGGREYRAAANTTLRVVTKWTLREDSLVPIGTEAADLVEFGRGFIGTTVATPSIAGSEPFIVAGYELATDRWGVTLYNEDRTRTAYRHFCEAERIDANGLLDLARMHFDEEMPQTEAADLVEFGRGFIGTTVATPSIAGSEPFIVAGYELATDGWGVTLYNEDRTRTAYRRPAAPGA